MKVRARAIGKRFDRPKFSDGDRRELQVEPLINFASPTSIHLIDKPMEINALAVTDTGKPGIPAVAFFRSFPGEKGGCSFPTCSSIFAPPRSRQKISNPLIWQAFVRLPNA